MSILYMYIYLNLATITYIYIFFLWLVILFSTKGFMTVSFIKENSMTTILTSVLWRRGRRPSRGEVGWHVG